jgi:hypothetical protein
LRNSSEAGIRISKIKKKKILRYHSPALEFVLLPLSEKGTIGIEVPTKNEWFP